jgi:hypothetical protein
MTRLPEGTAGGPRADGSEPGGVGDEVSCVLVRPEPSDGPTAQSLVATMVVDIEGRYADDGEAEDPEAEWAMGADEVMPPRGVFLVAYLDGQPVGCGAVRRFRPRVPTPRRSSACTQRRGRGAGA